MFTCVSLLMCVLAMSASVRSDELPGRGAELSEELVAQRIAILEVDESRYGSLLGDYQLILGFVRQMKTHERSLEYFQAAIADSIVREAEVRARIDDVSFGETNLVA